MALLAVMAALSILMAFTDSVTTETEGGQKTTYYGLVLRDGLWSPTLNYYCRLSHITEGGDSERASLLGDSVSRTCPLCRQTQKDRIDRQKQKAKEKNKGKQPEAAEEGLEDQAAEPANLQDIREFVLKEARYKRNISDWMHAVLTVLVFLALVTFTEPVVTCFFEKKLDPVIPRAVPTLVTTFAGIVFAFFPPPRASVGFPSVTVPPPTHDAPGNAAPVGAPAPSGGKQDEVAAAVAEAKAEGEKQRDDGDFDDVKDELEAAAAEPKVHLSAAKEKRLAERKQHETAGDGKDTAK